MYLSSGSIVNKSWECATHIHDLNHNETLQALKVNFIATRPPSISAKSCHRVIPDGRVVPLRDCFLKGYFTIERTENTEKTFKKFFVDSAVSHRRTRGTNGVFSVVKPRWP